MKFVDCTRLWMLTSTYSKTAIPCITNNMSGLQFLYWKKYWCAKVMVYLNMHSQFNCIHVYTFIFSPQSWTCMLCDHHFVQVDSCRTSQKTNRETIHLKYMHRSAAHQCACSDAHSASLDTRYSIFFHCLGGGQLIRFLWLFFHYHGCPHFILDHSLVIIVDRFLLVLHRWALLFFLFHYFILMYSRNHKLWVT